MGESFQFSCLADSERIERLMQRYIGGNKAPFRDAEGVLWDIVGLKLIAPRSPAGVGPINRNHRMIGFELAKCGPKRYRSHAAEPVTVVVHYMDVRAHYEKSEQIPSE